MTIEITDLGASALAPYFRLTERQLRRDELFIAESPKVIERALDAGYVPVSLLCEPRHIEGDAAAIIGRLGESVPVYTGSREMLCELTGYVLTRGVLCALRRRPLTGVEQLCRDARRVAVVYDVVDSTNVGSIFRSAAALGIDAVVLSAGACEPLNRRVARVSMGTVFQVPWTICDRPVEALRSAGFTTLAMALSDNSVSLRDYRPDADARLAIVVGTEGDGLSNEVIAACDHTVKIPMSHGVDSLNVGSAAAVAFYALG